MNTRKIIIVGLLVAFLVGGIVLTAGATGPTLISAQDGVGVDVAMEMERSDELVKYNVQVPGVRGLSDAAYQLQLNSTILRKALGEIEEVKGAAEEYARMAEVVIDFDVKSNDGILSFVVNTYTFTGGAHGITQVDTYNIDTRKCTGLVFTELFDADTDYKEVINKEIARQIEYKEENEDAMFFEGEDGFKTVSDQQNFYLEDGNLVLVFDRYDIAPGVMGHPEFKIPLKDLSELLREQEREKYLSVTGVVERVVVHDERTSIEIVDEHGNPAHLNISDSTYLATNGEINEGDTVVAFYDSSRPMILIYPPQYSVDVLALVVEGENIKVGKFDANLVSIDNMLKLNISDETDLVLPDGAPFEGELGNRTLAVIYGPSTKSIPAQTTPFKVVVLAEREVLPLYNADDIAAMDIIVAGEKVDGPRAYLNEEGIVMVPVRAISDGLGFDVKWNQETRSAVIGEGITVVANQDSYYKLKDVEIKLGLASTIKDDSLFVPINFFKGIVGMNNAYVFEGQIVVDNYEEMK